MKPLKLKFIFSLFQYIRNSEEIYFPKSTVLTAGDSLRFKYFIYLMESTLEKMSSITLTAKIVETEKYVFCH